MTIEVIYLWRALPNCSTETKEKIIEILKGAHVCPLFVGPSKSSEHCVMSSYIQACIPFYCTINNNS